MQECSYSPAFDSELEFGNTEVPVPPLSPVITSTWEGEEMDVTEYTFWVSSSLSQ